MFVAAAEMQLAAAHDAVAADVVVHVDGDDGSALLRGFIGRREAGDARADDDDVCRAVPADVGLRFRFARSERGQRRGAAGGRAGLQEMSAAEIFRVELAHSRFLP